MSSLALACTPELLLPALGKKRGRSPSRLGPHSLSRQDWPPAIVPDHVGVVDRSYVAVTDEFGRLAMVEFKKNTKARVAGEIRSVGKRVIDFAVIGQRAYAITMHESVSGDNQYMLAILSLAPATEPTVMSHLPLDNFSDPQCLAVSQDLVVVGGLSTKNTSVVAVYRRSRAVEPSLISTVTLDSAIARMDLQDRHLVVLGTGRATQIDYINLIYPHAPQIRKTLKIDGDYRVMARYHDSLMLAGAVAAGDFDVVTIQLEPAPHAVDHSPLENVTAVVDAAAQRGRFMVLAERGPERMVQTLTWTRTLDLTPEQTLILPRAKSSTGLSSRLALRDRDAYIAAGWNGVDVLTWDKMGWKHTSTLSIPRLPASSVVSWKNWVVLSSADLELYSISNPEKPSLSLSTEPSSPLRCIAGAGSFVLCLSNNGLALRKIENLIDVVASVNTGGQHMAYDASAQRVYVLASANKQTTVTAFKVYSNKISQERVFSVPGSFRRIHAAGGHILLQGLNELALYRIDANLARPDTVGQRQFDNLAIRDVALSDDQVLAAAVDKNGRGFLLLLSRQERDMRPIGAVDLPQDGAALAAAAGRALIVGKGVDGKDVLSVVNIANPATPAIVSTLPVVPEASAIAVKDDLAIVVGRGLELVRFT